MAYLRPIERGAAIVVCPLSPLETGTTFSLGKNKFFYLF
jgi:adenosine deaminase